MTGLRALALVLAAVAVSGAGCGGDDRRTKVDGYLREANAIQENSAPSFKRANEAYRAFAARKLKPREAVTALEDAEREVRAARGRLAQLRPPEEARRVHATLLRVYDGNVDFAQQTAVLASYQGKSQAALAPLRRVDRRLRRDLRRAEGPEAQAGALRRFSAGLSFALMRLRGLEVPPVLRPPHGDQVRRLSATREVAIDLRRALLREDAKGVARLLVRFRQARVGRRPRTGLAARALDRYDRRYRGLQTLYADLNREQRRLADAVE